MSTVATNFYVIGGTLRRDAPSYVKRQADENLYNGLMAGQFCYVLTSRQMGKSSLMVRTAVRLRADGVSVAVLDLTALGQNVTAEQWYQGLLGLVGEQFNLENELEHFWKANKQMGPLQRWMRAIREVVLKHKPGRVVIFVDEIDAVRSLPFSTDEFFAGIREFYNRRAENAQMERLTFCLLGVATPTDLIRDTRTTPFNIGRRVELADFTELEAAPLAQGFGQENISGRSVLTRILYWTGGHPYLTQRLCQSVAEDTSATDEQGVDRLCDALFLSARARERDDNLLFVRERLLRSEESDRAGLLDLYSQVHRGKGPPDDETNPLVSILRLSGIIRSIEGCLHVRNRIYSHVFDRQWILSNTPDAELRRQRAAFRKGVLRATAIGVVFLGTITALIGFALQQRNRSIRNAEELQRQKEVAEVTRVRQQSTSMSLIAGGTFRMGRSDIDMSSTKPYDLNQYPAHQVTVSTFYMDRTEVTNAEYADFVNRTKHAQPVYWRNGKPPAGQELWPLSEVGLDDANAFARWRSFRDGLKYRLPTEEEWEYAARNGSLDTLYPWGNNWRVDCANVESNSLEPVASYPNCGSQAGILDLIGNAWEWTSTKAAVYPGNTKLASPQGQVIRGGAYNEFSAGPDAITATRRSFVAPSMKDSTIGFRLVRDAQ